jgi:hypothetical protein
MTAVDDRTGAIAALLSEAEAAHGVFESTVLNGVYDQDWPRWYAAYAVEHGLGELLGHEVGAEKLSAFLASTFDEFKAAEPKPAEPWAAWTARRVAAEL